jgi:hypothetical protein
MNELNREHFESEMGKAGIFNQAEMEGLWKYAKEKTVKFGPLGMAAGFAIAAAGSEAIVVGAAAVVGFSVGKILFTQVMAGGDRVIREAAKSFSQHGRRSVDTVFDDDNKW